VKLRFETHSCYLNRPYFSWGWELDQCWVGFDFGNHHTDSPFSVTVSHTLSERQLKIATSIARRLT
jgi:hypothetical protein